jgi:hypothetical protein
MEARVSESQDTICDWADKNFGPAKSNLTIATRANEEMAELLRALAKDDRHPQAAEEAADVIIVLTRLFEYLGRNMGKLERRPRLPLAQSNVAIGAHANKRMAELISLLTTNDKHPNAIEKSAAVVNILEHLLDELGCEPWAVVEAKMAVNRKRVWRKQGDGTAYHVREKEAA